MDSVVVWVAQYLLFVLAAVVAGLVVAAPRPLRWRSVAAAVVGLTVVGVFIVIAATVHTDPRPFVEDPALHPLFAHADDNGFPSDHSAAAGLLTALAWRLRATAGVLVGFGAGSVATARVLAHVHHLQDVVAGLALGVVAGLVAIAVVERVQSRLRAGSSRGTVWCADEGSR